MHSLSGLAELSKLLIPELYCCTVKIKCIQMTTFVCAAFGFSVFGATTCMLDNVRGKDKPFTNAVIGGFLGGFCAGTRGKFS